MGRHTFLKSSNYFPCRQVHGLVYGTTLSTDGLWGVFSQNVSVRPRTSMGCVWGVRVVTVNSRSFCTGHKESILIVVHQCPSTSLGLLSILLLSHFFGVLLVFGFYSLSFAGFRTSATVQVLYRHRINLKVCLGLFSLSPSLTPRDSRGGKGLMDH